MQEVPLHLRLDLRPKDVAVHNEEAIAAGVYTNKTTAYMAKEVVEDYTQIIGAGK